MAGKVGENLILGRRMCYHASTSDRCPLGQDVPGDQCAQVDVFYLLSQVKSVGHQG